MILNYMKQEDKIMDIEVFDKREARAKMMGEGEMRKVLLTLAIPAIIAMVISAIYNIVDTLFVGMLKDTSVIIRIVWIHTGFSAGCRV